MKGICIFLTLALIGETVSAEAPFLSPLQAPSTVLPEEETEAAISEDTTTEETLEQEIFIGGSETENPLIPSPVPMVIASISNQLLSGPYAARVPVQTESATPSVVPSSTETTTGPLVEEQNFEQQPIPGVMQPMRPGMVQIVTAPVQSGPYPPAVVPSTKTGPYPPAVPQFTQTGPYPPAVVPSTQTGPYPPAVPQFTQTGPYPAAVVPPMQEAATEMLSTESILNEGA